MVQLVRMETVGQVEVRERLMDVAAEMAVAVMVAAPRETPTHLMVFVMEAPVATTRVVQVVARAVPTQLRVVQEQAEAEEVAAEVKPQEV